MAEYGVPVIEYRISGKVVDSRTESPVQGIAVTRIDDNPYIDLWYWKPTRHKSQQERTRAMLQALLSKHIVS